MQPGEHWTRRIAWDLLAVLAAYVLLRALVLHTAFDSVGLWMYELYPMGTMAELLQRGVDFPVRFYYDNAAGQVLCGLLTVPSFALAGPSYLALKLLPFVLGIGLLLLAWSWLRAHGGRTAANVGAWCLALGPTTLVKYSITCSGNHFENLFFSMLALWSFDRLQRRGATRARLFGFGLAAGFALFVFLGALLPLGLLAAVHAGARGLRACLRDLVWLAAGFVVGLMPLFWLNALTGARALGFLGAKFAGENTPATSEGGAADLGAILRRVQQYLVDVVPQASNYPEGFGLSARAWGWVFFLVLACVWMLALPGALRACARLARGLFAAPARPGEEEARRRDWPLVLLVGYVPLSALAYGVSNFRLGGHSGAVEYGGYRYYLPWFLFGILCLALLAGRAWSARGALRWPALALAAGVLVPGLSNLELVDWSGRYAGVGARYEGYDLSKCARGLLSTRNALSHEEQARYLERFPEPLGAGVARALGFNLAVLAIEQARRGAGAQEWSFDLSSLCADWPADHRAEIARGAGIGLRFSQGSGDPKALLAALERTLARADRATPELEACLFEGLAARNPALPLATETEEMSASANRWIGAALERGSPPALVQGLARGQGFVCGRLLRRGIRADREAVARRRAELPPALLAAFHAGLGAGSALGGERPDVDLGGLELDPAARAAFWVGFAHELKRAWPRGFEAVLAELDTRLAPADARELHAALRR